MHLRVLEGDLIAPIASNWPNHFLTITPLTTPCTIILDRYKIVYLDLFIFISSTRLLGSVSENLGTSSLFCDFRNKYIAGSFNGTNPAFGTGIVSIGTAGDLSVRFASSGAVMI